MVEEVGLAETIAIVVEDLSGAVGGNVVRNAQTKAWIFGKVGVVHGGERAAQRSNAGLVPEGIKRLAAKQRDRALVSILKAPIGRQGLAVPTVRTQCEGTSGFGVAGGLLSGNVIGPSIRELIHRRGGSTRPLQAGREVNGSQAANPSKSAGTPNWGCDGFVGKG